MTGSKQPGEPWRGADAFEELCCQLALADVQTPANFRRIRGDGGDGGVECMWTDTDTGAVHGWQAKHIPNLTRALTKSAESLSTACKNHPTLSRYVICLPFDLSGSRGRNGRSEQDRFDAFKAKAEAEARSFGRQLSVELWSDFILRERLRRIDPSGGRYRYWFSPTHLGAAWFSAQIDDAIRRAGPRYNPQLHHGHALDETLAALGNTRDWGERCASWHRRLQEATASWSSAVARRDPSDTWSGPFPASAAASGADLETVLSSLTTALADHRLEAARDLADAANQHVLRVSLALVIDLDARFGKGAASSATFRQRRAETHADLPAAHLDQSRDVLGVLLDLTKWLASPALSANTERILVVTGPAGIGKTHGLCDAADQRRAAGLPTLLVTGAQFAADRAPWESVASALGLDASWSRDVLLDALDTAGATTGRLLICIDALDERPQRTRWLDELPEIVAAIAQRPNLALCVSVREGYERQLLRSDLDLPVFVHPGFGGAVFDACSAFFRHFHLEPPVGPLLEPELANPLFLLVLCRTLQARGLTAIPPGWRGTRNVLSQLLVARDDELHRKHPELGTRAVSAGMDALAAALPEGGTLGWNDADRVVTDTLPRSQQMGISLLDYLVSSGLLRRLPGESDGWTHAEDRVDIAFGRLRHHLLADRLTRPDTAASPERLRSLALDDPGLAESLALILPERDRGELLDLATDPDERHELFNPWLAALPWRDPATLSARVEPLLGEARADPDLGDAAWDALLSLALRPGHSYDHRFLHALLISLPMAERDGALCGYLYGAFERKNSPLARALRAPLDADATRLDRRLRVAWCVLLGWCGSAADRRVRDEATRAAVRLSEPDPGVWSECVELFADVDDDAVLERVLCATYGAVLRNPEPTALADLAGVALARVLRRAEGPPQSALIRGHAQRIGEWAAHRRALPPGVRVEDFRPPHAAPIPLEVPTAADLKRYQHRDYPRLFDSVMSEWTGDFAKYTMPHALGGYEGLIGREESRRWVLGAALSLGYDPSLHGSYDEEMLQDHGPGRGKPAWAERIGKKYQRIALARLVGVLDDIAHAQGSAPVCIACENLRDLDPSVLQRRPVEEDQPPPGACWWAPVALDFASTAGQTDAEWVGGDDFPDPAALVAPGADPTRTGQRWRLLDGHFQWNNRTPERKGWYRDAWMMITGYLVPRSKLAAVRKGLAGEDFMGRWMPEGFDREGGIYVGEYPWSLQDDEEDSEPFDPRGRRFFRLGLRPVANRLIVPAEDWQGGTVRMTVPTEDLVGATLTRWDGTSGFRAESGPLVFQDPAAVGGGPAGLWIDDVVLAELCTRLDVALVWTVLAERRIIGDTGGKDFCGMKHASWMMWLADDEVRKVRARGEHLLPNRTRRPA